MILGKKKKEMSWYDVTLSQYVRLHELSKVEDDTDRLLAVAELMLGEEVTELPIQEFSKEVKKLSFMNAPIPEIKLPKKIDVNGRKYYFDCLLGNISTSQYVDFTTHAKSNDMSKMLSAFVIPEGHKYNDGYDMHIVMSDINELPIPVVQSAAFFFGTQLELFMRIFQHYSVRRIKKTRMPKEVKENMIKAVKVSVDLVLYHTSLSSAK